MLENDGHNTIMVYGGANMHLTSADIEQAHDVIANADIVVAQLEVPEEAIATSFRIAQQHNSLTILNPAPITSKLDANIISNTDLIIPNETEAAALAHVKPTTKTEELAQLAEKLNNIGLPNVIVTLGDAGIYYHVKGSVDTIPIFQVNTVDTTAAGDTFIGTFAANVQRDMSDLPRIIKRSCFASSLTVSRSGALVSIPTKQEVDDGLLTSAVGSES
ncbi:hypothetical protein GCM10025879_03560 [Leuconostoc litchii]|nr:hypothetical protein GCM10025879_03560 [Leuconostoc litchii]